ncbi:lytic transglycosylase domain-containing protein [Tardiphaga sp. vice352]|uniref:transglycosylase SLT domain-containing protein n=1 Tax=unclassified Tardiphaga TaxID=2631404 RepID=UPI001164A728|nr:MULTISPECIES: transglycosylase SLT domain-containing protein [unclassified Tardiphaga]MBC7583590.1 transglycosylase SLT domain-containing protein [Tardiphaga sp.]QDM17705.1 lytic transglycosylase domain-containing protein [Tardiphaga sp. vice278]QDM22765.1 lytic transglycosylase domain-containing protein [Tardiphaga sp. vice154]QDM27924.1 lytic transglycosylase domain-containing protein [Tardiphaga sp. vice304]QDM33066.1 lytic transglycosylase domain-containing protein [Tardiphaga sp. vice3
MVDATSITSAIDTTRSRVTGAIKSAAETTGTSFEYLLSAAKMESNFNPQATASTSSAKGLFQFIEQTWLGTVKEAGNALGYGKYADAISKSESGSYSVSDPAAKEAILKLRDDPVASSAMAGVLTQSNGFKLTGAIGRRPTDAELYMAHFMGVGGATKLITSAENNPTASGAALFPNAAAANTSIFYDQGGRARSVADVYSVLSTRYAAAAGSPVTRTALETAGATGVSGSAAATATAPAASAAYLASFPDLRNVQVASFASDTSSVPAATSVATQDGPIFRTLFQAGDRAQPVSQAVQTLWGNNGSLTSAAQPAVATPRPLDLFSDRSGTFSN